MAYMFQPQSCRFMLFSPFTEIITDQLQNLPFNPVNGIRLSFRSCNSDCHQSMNIETDSVGNLDKLSVVDTATNSADMIFDFSDDVFIHYGDSLDLICGHPAFHVLQQSVAAHYQAGHYTINVTPL